MCCTRLAANTGSKKVAKNRYLGTIAQLRRAISLQTRMWANAQRDGRPAEHMWRPLFNAAKFG